MLFTVGCYACAAAHLLLSGGGLLLLVVCCVLLLRVGDCCTVFSVARYVLVCV